jgi:hypothetical protein
MFNWKIGYSKMKLILLPILIFSSSISLAQQWSQFPFNNLCCGAFGLKKWGNKLIMLSSFAPQDTLVVSPFYTWDGNVLSYIPNLRPDNDIYCFEPINDTILFVGGDFNQFENPYTLEVVLMAKKIALFDGNSFSLVLPTNLIPDRKVRAIKFKESLYLGGPISFNQGLPNQINVNLVSRWDGTQIHDCDSGLFGSFGTPELNAFAVYNNELIAAGDFNFSRHSAVGSIAAWNGEYWHDLDSGIIGGYITNLLVDSFNNWLYVGGQLGYAGGFDGVEVCSVARWDGQHWQSISPPGCPAPFWYSLFDMEIYHGELYVSLPSNNDPNTDTLLMKYNGFEWKVITGINEAILDMEVYNDELICAGGFTIAGNDSCHGLARFYSPPDTTLSANKPLIEKTAWLWPPQPNPNSGRVLIPYHNPSGKSSTITIISNEGKTLAFHTCKMEKNYWELNTTHYPKGIYYITMLTDGWKKQSQKMVVE